MTSFFHRYVTAITTALFLVVGLSGLAMFFHVGQNLVRGLHEWLSLGLVAVAGLHIFKNWNAFKLYFKRGTIVAPMALAALASVAFMGLASNNPSRGEGAQRLARAFENARLVDLSRALDVSPQALQMALERKGFGLRNGNERVADVARSAQKPAMAVLNAALDARGG